MMKNYKIKKIKNENKQKIVAIIKDVLPKPKIPLAYFKKINPPIMDSR